MAVMRSERSHHAPYASVMRRSSWTDSLATFLANISCRHSIPSARADVRLYGSAPLFEDAQYLDQKTNQAESIEATLFNRGV